MGIGRRDFLRGLGACGLVAAVGSGCLLDARGTRRPYEAYVGQNDGGSTDPIDGDPRPSDAGDAGTDSDVEMTDAEAQCYTTNEGLVLKVFNAEHQLHFNPDSEDSLNNQLIPGFELTVGQLRDAALCSPQDCPDGNNGFVYDAEGFYRTTYLPNRETLRTALYNDLHEMIEQATCIRDEAGQYAVIDEMLLQIFDTRESESDTNFELRPTNSIYIARAVGNDGQYRIGMLMIGGTALDGQEGEPIGIFSNAQNIYDALSAIERE